MFGNSCLCQSYLKLFETQRAKHQLAIVLKISHTIPACCINLTKQSSYNKYKLPTVSCKAHPICYQICHSQIRKITFRRHCYQNPLEFKQLVLRIQDFLNCVSYLQEDIYMQLPSRNIFSVSPLLLQSLVKRSLFQITELSIFRRSLDGLSLIATVVVWPPVCSQSYPTLTVSKCHRNDWLRNPTCGHPSLSSHQAANPIPLCFNSGQILLERKTEDFLTRLHTIGQPPESLGPHFLFYYQILHRKLR